MELIKKTLVELLNIQGESGREGKVAKYVMQYLVQHNFSVYHDHYGNVLAERTFGEGPVLLLSAHMDTVVPFALGRRLIWEMDTLRSSEGILGADDRAGIAILLEVIRRVDMLQPNGTLKVAFTREEEIGRVGSNEIPSKWLADVDMAIVADRRNRRDIVTSCRRAVFCPEEVGVFWEQMGERIGQSD
jgi:tripeptide aminopeptidase